MSQADFGPPPHDMMTVAGLAEALRLLQKSGQVQPNSRVYAYEGEFTGLVIVTDRTFSGYRREQATIACPYHAVEMTEVEERCGKHAGK